MISVEYKELALEHLAGLESEKGADQCVLGELKKQIEMLCQYPEMAFPACFPHKGGHIYACNLFDQSGRMWSFSVLVLFTAEAMFVRAIHGGLSPDHFQN